MVEGGILLCWVLSNDIENHRYLDFLNQSIATGFSSKGYMKLSRGGSPESFRENLRPSRSESGSDTGLRHNPQIKQKDGKEKGKKKPLDFYPKVIETKSGWQDSNLRPPHPKCGAIPGYATPRRLFFLTYFQPVC